MKKESKFEGGSRSIYNITHVRVAQGGKFIIKYSTSHLASLAVSEIDY